MKVKYRHISDPDAENVYDTEKSYKKRLAPLFVENENITLEEWNRLELEHFRRDKEKGIILDYSVVEV